MATAYTHAALKQPQRMVNLFRKYCLPIDVHVGEIICDVSFTLFPVPGDFPENLIMTNRSSHAVLIEWSPPNEPNGIVTGYTIYVNYDNDTSEPERVLMTDGSTLRYTLENLLAFQLVSVQMTANTSTGEGPRSGSVEARTNPTGVWNP